MELSVFPSEVGKETFPELSKYHSFYGFDFLNDDCKKLVGWVDSSEFRVVLQTFIPRDPIGSVLIMHGYFDHAGIYGHLIRFLIEQGFAVAIHDMPGHGLSSGKRTSITDFSQYQAVLDSVLSACKPLMPEPFHAIGQSTGGAILLDRLSQAVKSPGIDFQRVILLAPLVRPTAWNGVKFLHRIVEPFAEVWKRSFSKNSNNENFVAFLKTEDPLQSKTLSVDWVGALKNWVPDIESRPPKKMHLTVIQGLADTTVEWKHNVPVIRRLFQDVKIAYLEGCHHHLVNESETKRKIIFKLISHELGITLR